MTTNFNKKNSLCKYFLSHGECFHGDNCQYIHSREPINPLLQQQQHQQQHHQHQRDPSNRTQTASMFPTSAAAAAVTANVSQTNSFTIGDSYKDLRDEIFRRQAAQALAANVNLMPTDAEIILPEKVQEFTDLQPLERSTNIGGKSSLVSSVFGFVTSLYRALNLATNQHVCLRRVHSFQANNANPKSMSWLIEQWKRIQCPNTVRLQHIFTTKDFGDNSLIFVYQYFPNATTLMQQYFNDLQNSGSGSGQNSIYGFSATNRPYSQQHAILKNRLLPENLLWHYIIQISSSLRLIHSRGLAYRSLDPTKVLITSPMPKCPPSQLPQAQYPRIRLNTCGLFDIVAHDVESPGRANDIQESHQQYQSDDLVAFGRLCLALATNSLSNAQRENWETALELVTRHYTSDVKALIVLLLSTKQQTPRRTINDIMPMIGARFYVQLSSSYDALDNAQAEIEREALNGKLFRLLVKLSMINDRPELRMDPSWSETGDRYMLKLFREYLFHQSTEDGTPWLDCSHVVSTLVKFDAGAPEKICLISRDEQHILVVSFAELKKCFENAFLELQS